VQILTLLAMEKPERPARLQEVPLETVNKLIHDERLKVLKAIHPVKLDDVVLGHYGAISMFWRIIHLYICRCRCFILNPINLKFDTHVPRMLT
jgi:hypothetical protein